MADGNESNWWPGRPESNRGPGGYDDPRTSGSRGGQPPWEQPVPPSWEQPAQPHWDRPPAQPPREQPRQPHWEQPGQPHWEQPGQRPQDRYPEDRYPQDRYPQDQGRQARSPRQDPGERGWADEGGPDGRGRQLPREAPDPAPYPDAPGGRHHAGRRGADAGRRGADAGRARPEEKRGLGRTVTFVGGGLIVAVVLVAFGLGFSRGGGPSDAPSSEPTEAVQPNPSVAAQAGPGAPTVTARSLGGQQVEFSWSYANPASGDTFRVQDNGGQPSTVNKPDLVLSVAQGQKACLQVQVVTASGTASVQSSKVCYPS